jgi:predicted phage terminase large subunit-like protein
MVLMPPGSAKSTYASVLFPPWFMGRNPEAAVLAISNRTELAERFSRRSRNLVSLERYRNVFGFSCAEDSRSAGNWENERGGEFFAAGVGAAIAGRRADLGLIDDPIGNREDADSERVREKQWDWYINDFCTRLKPGARQILIQCMTGATPILMADHTQKALRDVRPGDAIATYESGRISSSKVLNWANKGPDSVYAIRTKSGTIVKANERHPFLVLTKDGAEWKRLRNLRPGDHMARVLGESGAELNAHSKDVMRPRGAGAIAARITTRLDGLLESVLHQLMPDPGATPICATVTASTWPNTKICWQDKAGRARSAGSHQQRMPQRIGAASSAWITITTLVRRAGFYVTRAISPSVTWTTKRHWREQSNTCIHGDEIVEILPDGTEDVFDIQVERTENFIANGFVSHNTRWHEDDLGGRILERESEQWHVLKLPMEACSGDALGRHPGERLWPEWFTEQMVIDAKRDARSWSALYQQEPAPEEGTYFKREWFTNYVALPSEVHYYGASDYAVTDGDGDYTEHGIFAFDFNGDLHIVDWWRDQTPPNEWIEAQCDLIAKYKPLCWFGEKGTIKNAVESFLKQRMIERRTPCRLEWLPSITDKPSRARPFQAMASMSRVKIKPHTTWWADLNRQLMQFPAGKYDDGVDVCSLIGRGLEHVRAPELHMPKAPNVRPMPNSGGWMS